MKNLKRFQSYLIKLSFRPKSAQRTEWRNLNPDFLALAKLKLRFGVARSTTLTNVRSGRNDKSINENGLILIELLLLLAGASLFFYLFSPIDLWFSGLFWNGQDFVFTKTGFGSLFTVYLHSGMRIAFFIFAACGWFFLPWRKCLFIILCVALTAGLITNVVLKDHWGRARPVQVSQFGGTATFTPVWVISDQCNRNCSFVGGDASFAFCVLAPALLAARRRKLWISAALGFGTMISLGRIAAGAHFLSDCVIAGLMTVLVVIQIYRWMERDRG